MGLRRPLYKKHLKTRWFETKLEAFNPHHPLEEQLVAAKYEFTACLREQDFGRSHSYGKISHKILEDHINMSSTVYYITKIIKSLEQ